MRNFIQRTQGTLTAPYALAAGDGCLVGSMFAIAKAAAANGAAFEAAELPGIYTLTKATGETWAIGDKVYWDNSAKKVTKTSTSNTPIGAALSVQASGDTSGKVYCDGRVW